MTRTRTLRAAALLVMFLTTVMAEPIRLHPKNPHYFLFRGKAVVLITSAEHYGAVMNADFDYRRYLATLEADGLNYTRLFGGSYREVPGKSFGILRNVLAPAAGRFVAPWARSETPGYEGGGNGPLEARLALPAGAYAGDWLNTRTGKVEGSEKFQHRGGERVLKSPEFRNGIALRLHRARR